MPETTHLLELLLPVCLFAGAALFAYIGVDLFTRGWQSYEQRYVEGAERTLSAMYLTMQPQHLIYLSFLGGFAFGGTGLLLLSRGWAALVFGAAGFSIPRLVIALMKRRRDRLFHAQLPSAIDTINRGLVSGLSLPQCFQLIEREMPHPLSQEFRVVNRQVQLGMPPEQALGSLLNRMPSEDLDLVVTAILTAQELGGNLTEVLGNISSTIRERFKLQGKVRSLTSQGKLQAIILSSLPVLVFFALHAINPDLMRPMYTTTYGWAMLLGVIVWETLGVFFIWRLVAIRV